MAPAPSTRIRMTCLRGIFLCRMLAVRRQEASANIGPRQRRGLAEALLHKVAAMAGRVVLERGEDAIAELLVEAARLEAEGIEPDIAAAARHRLGLGASQQVASQSRAPQRLRQP